MIVHVDIREKSMRHTIKVIVLTVAAASFLGAQTDPPGRVGRLNYMDGPVSFQPAGVNDWVDANVNRPLIPGDNIWVGDRGRTELHVGSTALRLSGNTDFRFLNLDDRTVQIALSEGTLTVRMRNFTQNQVFEIDTPNVAFTILRPGEYRIDANPDAQTTSITVRDGEGDVTGGGEDFPLYARQRVVVRGYDRLDYNLASFPGPDAWDQWCSTRDRREDQSQSARYVSREVAGYDDLDQYGRWDNQPGYGSVWMPTSVGAGWAPYHDGHWAWIAPWGWTWVDDAPWGFAPYHYGRWASFGGRWGWIPGPYEVTPVYAPALVAWVGGRGGSGFSLSFSIGSAAAIGWFPLGPREPYFPSYQASQGYFQRVNTANTVINNTTINNYYASSRNFDSAPIANIRYANQSVPNGVTAVPQQSFARGQRVTQEARAVPAAQLTSAQVFASPSIAPQRESVLGSRADTASRAQRPPANAASRPVVARTAPPPAPVPFERQRPALDRNPGRPLPNSSVQELRQGAPAPTAPVRVVDMSRVRRVQPAVGADAAPQPGFSQQGQPNGQQKGRQQSQPEVARPQAPQALTPPPQAITPQPPVNDRQKGKQDRRQEFPQQQQPQQQQAAPPQADRPQPPAFDRQRGKQDRQPGPQQPQPQVAPPQATAPQPPVIQNQRGENQRGNRRQEPPQQQQQQPPQAAPPQADRPQPPTFDRQKGKQDRQPGPPQSPPAPTPAPQAAPPPAPVPQAAPAPAAPPPPAEGPRQNKGKQQKSDGKGKSDN
jgi:hypothetical protein